MRFVALAIDYDGTLAHDGRVEPATEAALSRLRAAGRRVLLVTGRRLPALLEIWPHVSLVDLVVAENGGVLYAPATQEERVLASPPPPALLVELQARGVQPLTAGRVVVETWQPHQTAALEAIRALGLEHHVVFNKGAVMILPPAVNKASGLAAALAELHLSRHNLVAAGDAENDVAMLEFAECAVAVANALPLTKDRADIVTAGDHGQGVIEAIEQIIADDLRAALANQRRHDVLVGVDARGAAVSLPPYGVNVLIAGSSGSGKSTIVARILECLAADGYQSCVIDPEGDYDALEHAVVLGGGDQAPAIETVLGVLRRSDQSAVANLTGVPLLERPAYFAAIQEAVAGMRAEIGRPHWLVLDEAHHLVPHWGSAKSPPWSTGPRESLVVTVEPAHVAHDVLTTIDIAIVTGRRAHGTLASYCGAVGVPPPNLDAVDLPPGEALVWLRQRGGAPARVHILPPHAIPHRHRRKYAQGAIDVALAFVFRSPTNGTSLRAENLTRFAEIAGRIDDDTWLFHLRRGDYARWFREIIKDELLADEASRAEALVHAVTAESREVILQAIAERYTLPR